MHKSIQLLRRLFHVGAEWRPPAHRTSLQLSQPTGHTHIPLYSEELGVWEEPNHPLQWCDMMRYDVIFSQCLCLCLTAYLLISLEGISVLEVTTRTARLKTELVRMEGELNAIVQFRSRTRWPQHTRSGCPRFTVNDFAFHGCRNPSVLRCLNLNWIWFAQFREEHQRREYVKDISANSWVKT